MAKKPSSSALPTPTADTRVCVIHGQEEMLKRQLLDQLRQTLIEKYHEVETLVFDGKTASLADVLDELRSYGLMQQHKMVIVDDADVYVTQHRQAMERYAQSPVDNGVLVLRSTKWNRGGLDKLIEKVGFIAKCEPLAPAAASAWVVNQVKEKYQSRIEPAAANLLVEKCGRDLSMLDAELSKLTLMVEGKAAVDKVLVEQVVGRSSEEDAWAVQEALLASLGTGRSGPTLEKVYELVELAGHPEELVSYFLADMMRKLSVAKQMAKQGQPPQEISREMKLWGPRQASFMSVLKQVDEAQLGRWLDQIVSLNVRARTGLGDTYRGLELFAATLARQSAGRR